MHGHLEYQRDDHEFAISTCRHCPNGSDYLRQPWRKRCDHSSGGILDCPERRSPGGGRSRRRSACTHGRKQIVGNAKRFFRPRQCTEAPESHSATFSVVRRRKPSQLTVASKPSKTVQGRAFNDARRLRHAIVRSERTSAGGCIALQPPGVSPAKHSWPFSPQHLRDVALIALQPSRAIHFGSSHAPDGGKPATLPTAPAQQATSCAHQANTPGE